MRKHSRHHRTSRRKTRRSNSVIHIRIRPWNTTPTMTNRSFNSNISNKRNSRTTDRNKVSPQKNKMVHDQVYQNETPVFHLSKMSAKSSDRMNIIKKDHHRHSNRKKKKTCSYLCVIPTIIVTLLLSIVAITLLVFFLVKSTTTTTTSNNRPTGTNYTLRWLPIGVTVAGVVSQPGTAANLLNVPFGLTVDYANSIYIGDSSNNRVQCWLRGASAGTTVAGHANGTWGKNASDLRSPAGVVVDSNNNIYVADGANARIQFWAAGATSGVTVAGDGTPGNLNSQLSNPYGITLDSSSNTLYISDYVNHRVMRYLSGATSGSIVAGNGTGGTTTTQLLNPTSVYFDSISNSLVIANYAAYNVVRWTLGANNWTLIGGSISSLPGNTSTLLKGPVGVTMDPMGNVYAADMPNHRIQFFPIGQSDAVTIAGMTGISGTNSTLLNAPYCVALDNQLNLYVTDTSNHRVQRFSRY